jgi:hypothetical protein
MLVNRLDYLLYYIQPFLGVVAHVGRHVRLFAVLYTAISLCCSLSRSTSKIICCIIFLCVEARVGRQVRYLLYYIRSFLCIVARVGRQVEMTSGCIVGAKCDVSICEVLSENTVIYGSDCQRRIAADKPPVSNAG